MLTITEINSDLFTSRDVVYAHCVSKDFKMGAGIAKVFNNRYKYMPRGMIVKNYLLDQNVDIGGCAVLEMDNKIIFYLVTKLYYYDKPTIQSLKQSLLSMKEILKNNYSNIDSISIPKIGCGLDKLNWNDVKILLEEIFSDSTVKFINVYYI